MECQYSEFIIKDKLQCEYEKMARFIASDTIPDWCPLENYIGQVDI